MRLLIHLSDFYAQQMLKDNYFISNLNFSVNIDGLIIQIWVENTVLNNDESTFRMQTLNMIAGHFCRIFNEQSCNVEIANNERQIPDFLVRLKTTEENRKIASISNFQ